MLREEQLAELESVARDGTPWYQFAVHAMPIMPALLAEIRAARAWRKEAERLLREAREEIGDWLFDMRPSDRPTDLIDRLDAFLGEGEGKRG